MKQPRNEVKSSSGRAWFGSPACLALLLAIITTLVYWPVHSFEFTNYDDQEYVTANDHIKAGLSWSGIKWAFSTGYASNWHPLTWVSHMVDVQFFGLNPAGHHGTSVLLHTLATLFLFLGLNRLTRAKWRSLFVAALFAWHPMHVESVAWIAERKDVLCGFFGMLTLWFYALYVEARKLGNSKAGLTYGAVIICFTLGLLAKPMLVTFPLVLLLLDFWPLQRMDKEPWGKLVFEKVPLLLLSVTSSVVTFFVQHSAGAVRNLSVIPLDSRVFNSLIAYWRYLAKLFCPTHLAVFYPMPEWISGWLGLLAGFVIIGVSVMVFVWRKKVPALLIGWLWFLGMLVPVIGIVQVGAQSMADRYSYLPSIGVFIALVWLGEGVVRSIALKPWAISGSLFVLLACVTLTEKQLPYWKDTVTLFEHALKVTPGNFVAHINLGSALMQRGQLDSALDHYEQSLLLQDDFFEAHYGAAVICEKQGKLDLAVERYRKATELRPGAAIARNNLGALLLRLGKPQEAIKELERTIQIDPNYAAAHYNLALVLANSDPEQSIGHYYEAVRLKPDYADAINNLGVALASAGKYEASAKQLLRLVQLMPVDAEAHFNLSFVLMKLGRTNESKEHHDLAFKLNPDLARKK
jgi:Tfp pilus assembly protein PilF